MGDGDRSTEFGPQAQDEKRMLNLKSSPNLEFVGIVLGFILHQETFITQIHLTCCLER